MTERISLWNKGVRRHLVDFPAEIATANVRIYSGEHGAYWRPNGCGYCCCIEAAGVYSFGDAFNRTWHCGPEKGIWYEPVEQPDVPHGTSSYLNAEARSARDRAMIKAIVALSAISRLSDENRMRALAKDALADVRTLVPEIDT